MWVILAVGFAANEVMHQTGSWVKTLIFITLVELVVSTVGILVFATLIERLLRNVRDDEHDQMVTVAQEARKARTLSAPVHELCGARHWPNVDCPW